MEENSIEEDIIKEFEKLCENWYVFKDDDMGGHFEGIIGDQIANTKLGYLIFKEKLEEKMSDYKRALKELEELKDTNCLVKRYFKLKDTNTYLRKENEELKENNKYIIHLTDEQYNVVIENAQNDIKQKWIQKVKDKIEEYKNMLKTCNKAKDIERIKAINERILELEELLEEKN